MARTRFTVQDITDNGSYFATQRRADYNSGYVDARSDYSPAKRERATVIALTVGFSGCAAYNAGYARGALDVERDYADHPLTYWHRAG